MANIKNELNNIKSAVFGKDVRKSIHDGIDAINKEVESTTGRQVDLENIFDQLVINAGNSNAEIVDARVGENGKSYAKLGDRLDEVDSQLEQVKKYSIIDNTNTKLIGHRGFSYLFPENCIETLSEIKKYGDVGIEVDLRVTSDGEIILMHDSTVDRTTNGAGSVSSLTLSEIKKLECGSYFDKFYKGITIPTLDEFLGEAKWCNFIVLQLNDFPIEYVSKVVELIEKYNMIENCYIYTVGEYGQRKHFDKLYELNNKIKRIYRPNVNDADDIKNFKEAKGVRYYIEWASTLLNNPNLVKEYGNLGIGVMASTTTSKMEYKKLNEIGVSKCLAETIWEV